MKIRNSLLWIQIMFVRCCIGSISVSSDFTIKPSLDQSSSIESGTTNSIGRTVTPFLTTETSGIYIETTVKSMQSITLQSTDSPSLTLQTASSNFDVSESTMSSYSNSGISSTEPTATYISLNSVPTTKVNSVLTNSMTSVISSSSVNSFSKSSVLTSKSLETVSSSSSSLNYVENNSSIESESARETINTNSKSSLETTHSHQETVSDISSSKQTSMSTPNFNSESVESTIVISSSLVESGFESGSVTNTISPTMTLTSNVAESSSSLKLNITASDDKSSSFDSYISLTSVSSDYLSDNSLVTEGSSSISSDYSSDNSLVTEGTSIQSSEFNFMQSSIQSVISKTHVSQTMAADTDTYFESNSLITSPSLSPSIQRTPTISVISGTTRQSDSLSTFPQSVSSISSYSGSSSIVSESSMSRHESITQIQPSPVSTSLDSLDVLSTTPVFSTDGIKDSNSVSVQTLSILSVSELSSVHSSISDGIKDSDSISMQTNPILNTFGFSIHSSLFASSAEMSGIMYTGKSSSELSRETLTIVTSILNSQTVSSPLTSSLKSTLNVSFSQSSERVSTELRKVSSTVTSATSTFLSSTSIVSSFKQSPIVSTSSYISSDEDSLVSITVSTEHLPTNGMVTPTIPSTYRPMSTSLSSISHSSITDIVSYSTSNTRDSNHIVSNNVSTSITQSTESLTKYRSVLDGTMNYNISSSESAILSSNFISYSSDTSDILTTESSGILSSIMHETKSTYLTSTTGYYEQSSSSLLSPSETQTISTSMSLVLHSDLSSTQLSNSLITEMIVSTIGNTSTGSLFLSAPSDTFKNTDTVLTLMSNSASMSPNTELLTSSLTQESLSTLDTTKTDTMTLNHNSVSNSYNTSSSSVTISFTDSLRSISATPSSELDILVSTTSSIISETLYPSYTNSLHSVIRATSSKSEEQNSTSYLVSTKSDYTDSTGQVETSTNVIKTITDSVITSTYFDISPSRTIQIVSNDIVSTEQPSTSAELFSSSNTPVFDKVISLSTSTRKYSTNLYSSVSSEMSKSATTEIIFTSDSRLTSSIISEKSTFQEVSTGLLSSMHTGILSSSASVISHTSPTYDPLPARTSIGSHQPTTDTSSFTILTSDFSPSISLISSIISSDKSSSFLNDMSDNISFISASSEETTSTWYSSTSVSPISISPSSLPDTVLTTFAGNTTRVLNITESESLQHETLITVSTSQHMTPTTGYSIYKSFESGSSSFTLFTNLLSSELSMDTISKSFDIKTDTSTLSPSTYFSRVSTVDGQFTEHVSMTPSYVSVTPNESSLLYTSKDTPGITLASTNIKYTLSASVDSTTGSQLLLTTLPTTLTSQVKSTVEIDQTSVSASSFRQISGTSISALSTKSETIYKTDSAASLYSSSSTASVNLISISTSVDQLVSRKGTVSTSPTTSTVTFESGSSLYSSFSHVSLYTVSFISSSVDRNTMSMEELSPSASSLYSLSTIPNSQSDMTRSLTNVVSLTSSILESGGTQITTHERSSSFKTIVTESQTLSISSSKESYSSENSQSKLTISGFPSLSSQIETTILKSESRSAATITHSSTQQAFSSIFIYDKSISSSNLSSLMSSFPETVVYMPATTLSSSTKSEASSQYQSTSIYSTTSKSLIGSISTISPVQIVSTTGSPLSIPRTNLLDSSTSTLSGVGFSTSNTTDIHLSTNTPLMSIISSSSINLLPTYWSTSSLSTEMKSFQETVLSTTKSQFSSVSTFSSDLITTHFSVSKPSSVPTSIQVSTSNYDSILISASTISAVLKPTFYSIFTSVSLTTSASTTVSNIIPTSELTTLSVSLPFAVSSLLSSSVNFSSPLSSSIPLLISTSLSSLTKPTVSTHLSDSMQLIASTPPLVSTLLDSVSTTLSTSIPITASTPFSTSIHISEADSEYSSVEKTSMSTAMLTLVSISSSSASISTFSSTSSSDLTSFPVLMPSSVSMSIASLASLSVPTSVTNLISKTLSSSVYLSVPSSVFNSRVSTTIISSQISASSLEFSQTTSATPPLQSIRSSLSTVNLQDSSNSSISISTSFSSEYMILTSQVSIPVESSATVQSSSFEQSTGTATTSIFSPLTTKHSTILGSESLVTEIKSTTIPRNETSLSLISSTYVSSGIPLTNGSTAFLPTSMTLFSMVSEPLTSLSISLTSVTRTVTLTTSSSITPTTSQPPEQTTINATNARESKWARTVLKIQRYINISDPTFVKDLESRFAEAFNEAFIRLKLIKEGKFEPLEKRRRRKRFTSVGDASVHIHDVSRVEDTTEVAAVYSVEKSDQVLSAEEAVSTLDVLDTQELAIILKQVVDVKAEPYTQSETPTEPDEETSQLLLYVAIAGGVGGTIILIWIIACIYCKCCRQKRTEEDAEPELTSIQPQPSKLKESIVKPMPVTPKKKTLVPQGSKFSLRKGRTYEINHGFADDNDTDEQTLLKSSPRKKNLHIPESPYNGSTSGTPVIPKKELVPPVKKGRRNSKNSIGPTTEGYENEIMKYNSPKNDRSQMFQSSISEDSEDTKLQMKAERKRNKERMAEKYRPELEVKLREREQPKTESKILGMPNTAVPSFVIESGSPIKEHIPLSRKASDGNTSGEENLQEARSRMHKLLDEAFSLISPRNSLTETDISAIQDIQEIVKSSKQPEADQTKPLVEKPKGSKSSPNMIDVDKALETLKGFTNPGYTSSYSDFFETWSPYRSTNQEALISMPNKPEPSVTRLGNKSDKRPMTSTIATNGSRRPAANLEISNIKSISEAPDTSKYATTSPKPIVIRTKDDAPNSRLASAKSNKISNELQNNRNFSATALNSDIFLNGSSTSLTKNQHPGRQRNDSLELQTLKRNRKNSMRSQRASETDNRNNDDIDVIKNIKPVETGDNLYKSLKEEIKGVSNGESTEDDINKKPIRRRNRKAHSKPMTDIV